MEPGSTFSQAPRVGQPAGWRCFIALIPGFLFSNVEVALVNIALPVIRRDLEVESSMLGWVPLACLLTTAALSPLMGAIADRVGRKQVYLFGLAVVSAGSLMALLSPGLRYLLVARVLQGVGAAAVIANGLAIVAEQFRQDSRGRAIGLMTALMAVGAIIAPVLGGIISEELGWRAIFALELLVVAPGVPLVWMRVPELDAASPGGWRGLPWLPAGALAMSAFSGIFGLWAGGLRGWQEPGVLGLIGAAIMGAVASIYLNRRSRPPLFDLSNVPPRKIWSLGPLLFGSLLMGSLGFTLPLYLADIEGFHGLELGLEVVPFPIGLVIGAVLGGAVGDRKGTAGPVLVGLLVAATGLLAYTKAGSLALVAIGMGMGAFSVGNNAELVHGSGHGVGALTGLIGLLRLLGSTAGIALAGVVIVGWGLEIGVAWIAWTTAPGLVAAAIAYSRPSPSSARPD